MSLGDTSGFQLAIVKDAGVDAAAITATALQILPVVDESINSTRESKRSMEMDGTRQTTDTKIVKASVGGGINVEMAFGRLDGLLEAGLQGTWIKDNSVSGHSEHWLMDGSSVSRWMFEKLNRVPNDSNVLWNYFDRSYQNVIDSMSFSFPPGEIIKCAINVMGTTDQLDDADASSNPLNGKIASVTTYTPDAGKGKIDASNSLNGLAMKDSADQNMAVILQDLSLSISNNMRVRDQVGSVYSAQHGNGDVTIEVDAKVYFKNQKVKKDFFDDKPMKLSFTLQDPDDAANKYVVHMDRVKVQSHSMPNAGKSQDLIESVKFEALPYDLTMDSNNYRPCIAIQRYTA